MSSVFTVDTLINLIVFFIAFFLYDIVNQLTNLSERIATLFKLDDGLKIAVISFVFLCIGCYMQSKVKTSYRDIFPYAFVGVVSSLLCGTRRLKVNN